jgi:hypothetical protein
MYMIDFGGSELFVPGGADATVLAVRSSGSEGTGDGLDEIIESGGDIEGKFLRFGGGWDDEFEVEGRGII